MIADLFANHIDVPLMVRALPQPIERYRNAACCVAPRSGGFCVYGQPFDTLRFDVVAYFWDESVAKDAAKQLDAVITATRRLTS